jgi:hypothetical protein
MSQEGARATSRPNASLSSGSVGTMRAHVRGHLASSTLQLLTGGALLLSARRGRFASAMGMKRRLSSRFSLPLCVSALVSRAACVTGGEARRHLRKSATEGRTRADCLALLLHAAASICCCSSLSSQRLRQGVACCCWRLSPWAWGAGGLRPFAQLPAEGGWCARQRSGAPRRRQMACVTRPRGNSARAPTLRSAREPRSASSPHLAGVDAGP